MSRDQFSGENATIQLPAFFASISSLKTSLSVPDYLRILVASATRTLLLSAFDLRTLPKAVSRTVREHLTLAMSAGRAVLFDSGNYESYWTQDRTWSQASFHDVLGAYPCSCALSYDVYPPTNEPTAIAEAILSSLEKDARACLDVPVIPIVHGNPTTLPKIVSKVAQLGNCEVIAIPERELGSGIFDRSKTISTIRQFLDAADCSTSIHLLGTGNPLSIAVYALLGADSFDGLEWCQTAVHPTSGLLYHLSHGELFWEKKEQEGSQLDVSTFTLLKNIEFFARWISEVAAWRKFGVRPRSCPQVVDLAEQVVQRIQA